MTSRKRGAAFAGATITIAAVSSSAIVSVIVRRKLVIRTSVPAVPERRGTHRAAFGTSTSDDAA
jgi:hypothetical protein